MEILISFWTLILVTVGFLGGYLVGKRDLDKKIDQIKSKTKRLVPDSGAVKMLTQLEKDAEKDTEGGKIRELIK